MFVVKRLPLGHTKGMMPVRDEVDVKKLEADGVAVGKGHTFVTGGHRSPRAGLWLKLPREAPVAKRVAGHRRDRGAGQDEARRAAPAWCGPLYCFASGPLFEGGA